MTEIKQSSLSDHDSINYFTSPSFPLWPCTSGVLVARVDAEVSVTARSGWKRPGKNPLRRKVRVAFRRMVCEVSGVVCGAVCGVVCCSECVV